MGLKYLNKLFMQLVENNLQSKLCERTLSEADTALPTATLTKSRLNVSFT